MTDPSDLAGVHRWRQNLPILVGTAALTLTLGACGKPAGTEAACDSLAYDISNAGGGTALVAASEDWGVMVRQYRYQLGDSGDALVRDSADVLARVAGANEEARTLALDTAAARCMDAGWKPA